MFFVTIALFFTGVGLAQVVLFKGRNPRTASIVAGVVLSPLAIIGGGIVRFNVSGDFIGESDQIGYITLSLVTYFLSGFGMLLGYLAGVLIAGFFLLLNKVQTPLDDPASEGEDSTEKSPDKPAVDEEDRLSAG